MKKAKLATLGLSSVLLLAACGGKGIGNNSPDNPPAATPAPASPQAASDFANMQAQIFQPYCIQCHSNAGGNRGGVNVETYQSVQANLARINDAVLIRQHMPPRAPLPAELQARLASWIAAGAPETVIASTR